MGLFDVVDNEEEQTQSSGDKPSKTYIHLYEQGHEEAPDGHNHKAFDLVSSGGLVRSFAKQQAGHHTNWFAELIVTLGEALKSDSLVPVLEAFEPDVDDLVGYLSEHPDVAAELAQYYEEDEEDSSEESDDGSDDSEQSDE